MTENALAKTGEYLSDITQFQTPGYDKYLKGN